MPDASHLVFLLVAILGFALLAVSALLGSLAHSRLCAALREHAPEIWKSLGSPNYWSISRDSHYPLLWWVLRGRYNSTRQPTVIRYASLFRFTLFIDLAFVIAILAFVLAA